MKKPEKANNKNNRSLAFTKVRKAHKMETAEDYVELIADLIKEKKEARMIDLAEQMGVSPATVSNILVKLKNNGYIKSQPYRSIFLTPKGEALAKKCKEKHQIIVDFLIHLGVSPEIASFDAEGIEHHISKETLKAFKKFIKNSKK